MPVSSGRSGGARDSVSRGRRGFRLTDEELVTRRWGTLPAILTVQEAATRSRLSAWTIRQFVHAGDLAALQVGKRLLIPRDSLQQFLEGGRTVLTAVPTRARR